MAATQQTLDVQVRSFLQRMGYSAEQYTFVGVDYDTFLKLPDNLLRRLGLSDSFIEDHAVAKASFVSANKPFVEKIQTDTLSERFGRYESDDFDDDYSTTRIPSYIKEDHVTSLTMPRLGDGCCCCGRDNDRLKVRPQSPDAYQTQRSEYYYYD